MSEENNSMWEKLKKAREIIGQDEKTTNDLLEVIALLLDFQINSTNFQELYQDRFVSIGLGKTSIFGLIVQDLGHAILVDEYSIVNLNLSRSEEKTSGLTKTILDVSFRNEGTYVPKNSIVSITKSGFRSSEIVNIGSRRVIERYNI